MSPSATGFQFGDNLAATDMGGGVVRVDATPALPPGTAVGQVLTWNGSAWTPTTPDWVKIAEAVLASTQSQIQFTSIPQTYKHLKVIAAVRDNIAQNVGSVRLRFNGDASAAYWHVTWWAHAGASTGAGGSSAASDGGPCGLTTGTSAPANAFADFEITIPDYATAGVNKNWRSDSFSPGGLSASLLYRQNYAGFWASGTGAITSLTFYPPGGSFVARTTFQLYGMK